MPKSILPSQETITVVNKSSYKGKLQIITLEIALLEELESFQTKNSLVENLNFKIQTSKSKSTNSNFQTLSYKTKKNGKEKNLLISQS